MTKLSRLLWCVVFAGLTTGWAIAQDSDTHTKSKGEVRSITGCVTKGPSANEFLLTASDGSTWEVHNNNAIDLTSHLGHTIKVKGVVSHSKMHNMKEDAKGVSERHRHEEEQYRARSLEGHRRPHGQRILPTVELRRIAGKL